MGSNRIEIIEKPVELKHLTPVKGDYKATVGDVGICEVKGHRNRQEDTITVDVPSATSDAFMALSPEDRAQVSEATFATIQSPLENKFYALECGSCACIATGHVKANKATVSTSYVGDSVGFLVVLAADGTLKSVTACNPALHDGDNETECAAIKQGIGRKKGDIVGKRLCAGSGEGILAVTRAFGDNVYAEYGLLHAPETTDISVDIASDDRVFMVVTCDGAMEHCKGSHSVAKYAEELGVLFANNHKLLPEALAEKIVDYALEKGSGDNITAIVVPLEIGKPAVTIGVFDGHGGTYISKHVSANFNKAFQHHVDHVDDIKKKRQSGVNKIKRLLKKELDNNGNIQLKVEQPKKVKTIGLLAITGIIVGAIVGSFVSLGIGTVVGALVGGFCGGFVGKAVVWVTQQNIVSKRFKRIKEESVAEENQTPLDDVKPAKKIASTSTAMFMESGYVAIPPASIAEKKADDTIIQKLFFENYLVGEVKNNTILSSLPFKPN